MDSNLKIKLLKQLAEAHGEDIEAAIEAEADKISSKLMVETQYDLLEEQLKYLSFIAFRVSSKTVEIIRQFFRRLDKIQLSYQVITGITDNELKKLYSKFRLILKGLEILKSIRYHQIEGVLDIFFEYLLHKEEKISKYSVDCLKSIAEYNIGVYCGGKTWGGLRAYPQEKLLSKISMMDDKQLVRYFSIITDICAIMLSPTMRDSDWKYDSVTIRTAAIPVEDDIKSVRVGNIEFLERLYTLAGSVPEKIAIINSIQSGCKTPSNCNYSDNLLDMIAQDITKIILFFIEIAGNADLEVISEIEHTGYWIYRNYRDRNVIREHVIKIKKLIDDNNEYQIYKNLVRYDWIDRDWDNLEGSNNRYDVIQKEREKQAKIYAEAVNDENFDIWKDRVVRFSKIHYRDMALFVYLDYFLKHFGFKNPNLAIKLLEENIGDRIVPLLKGLWITEKKEELDLIINKWISENKYLLQIIWSLEDQKSIDFSLFERILQKAISIKDVNVLVSIIAVVIMKYNVVDNDSLLRCLFVPALSELTSMKDTSWINRTWFLKELPEFLSLLEIGEVELILRNVLLMEVIDFHAEEVLSPIANKFPDAVIALFSQRMDCKKDFSDKFEVMPHEFYKLQNSFIPYVDKAVDTISGWYDNYSGFMMFGARLLRNMFPQFPLDFQEKLIKLVRMESEKNIRIVLAILRNYRGQTFIYPVCKEIIKSLPSGSELLDEVEVVLYQTGVVSGEFGFSNAYAQKKEMTASWLNDENIKIRAFAVKFHSGLDVAIEQANARAKEDIELRKHQFRTRDGGEGD